MYIPLLIDRCWIKPHSTLNSSIEAFNYTGLEFAPCGKMMNAIFTQHILKVFFHSQSVAFKVRVLA